METCLAAPIVLLIQLKFCWCEVKEGKCGLELWKGSLEKQYGDSWGLNCHCSVGCDGCVTAADRDLLGSHCSTMARGEVSDRKPPQL